MKQLITASAKYLQNKKTKEVRSILLPILHTHNYILIKY